MYAGFWRRAGAMTIDGLILATPGWLLAMLGVSAENPWWDIIAWTLVGWVYYALLHSSRWQATPGKRAFGIKVTGLDGARINFGRATWRYVASFLSGLILGIGYFMAGWTSRKQALHDMMARTLVVDASVAAEEVPHGAGVMPLPARTKWAIAGLLIVEGALTLAMATFADPQAALRRESGAPVATQSAGRQEEISYAIYSIPFFGGEPELVKRGKRSYRHSEVSTTAKPTGDEPIGRKSLRIADGFAIDVPIFRESQIDGFGLTLSKEGGTGFSWEWFDRESGDVFRKRQGGGQVQVRFTQNGSVTEIAEVLFIDDVTMRLDRYWLIPFHRTASDHLVIERGSVLWLAE